MLDLLQDDAGVGVEDLFAEDICITLKEGTQFHQKELEEAFREVDLTLDEIWKADDLVVFEILPMLLTTVEQLTLKGGLLQFHIVHRV